MSSHLAQLDANGKVIREKRNKSKSSNQNSDTKVLGSWYFDKKQRGRRYVALTGKIYSGVKAFLQAKLDERSLSDTANSARQQLKRQVQQLSASVLLLKHQKYCATSTCHGNNKNNTATGTSLNTNTSLRSTFYSQSGTVSQHSVPSSSSSSNRAMDRCGGIDTDNLLLLKNWGIPERTLERYARQRVTELFPWQLDCLLVDNGKALSGGNLIYSAPTSGGKTLVAELLMLRQIGGNNTDVNIFSDYVEQQNSSHQSLTEPCNKMTTNRELLVNESHLNNSNPIDGMATLTSSTCRNNRKTNGVIFFIVPFISLAEEKCNYFQEMWQDMNIGIRSFHGEETLLGGGNKLSNDIDVAICTIERANILFTQLLEEKREDILKMVVIDEIHMLSDSHRGFLLEVLLTKIKYVYRRKRKEDSTTRDTNAVVSSSSSAIQVVGMSATLPNISDLTSWIGASLYCTTMRPVNLSVKVCIDKVLYLALSKDENDYYDDEVTIATGDTSQISNFTSSTLINSSSNSQSSAIVSNGMYSYTQVSSIVAENSHVTNYAYATNNSISVANSLSKPPEEKVYFEYDEMLPNYGKDEDGLKSLCIQTILEDKSVLVFCNSKARCQTCASSVAQAVLEHSRSLFTASRTTFETTANKMGQYQTNGSVPNNKRLFSYIESAVPLGSSLESRSVLQAIIPTNTTTTSVTTSNMFSVSTHDITGMCKIDNSRNDPELNRLLQLEIGRKRIIDELSQTSVGLCQVLRDTVPQGVAYHHAGLTMDERKIIEEGYRNGFINILFTTSTLSAGVNLPAHRVIIRTPKMGDINLSVATFRQMCGRAGRLGLDTEGEAILMILNKTEEKELAKKLLTAEIDKLISSLHCGYGGGIEKLLLEMICCGRLTKESDVKYFVNCTLMATQHPQELVKDSAIKSLNYLKSGQFIMDSSDGTLDSTQLGIATTLSGIPPREALAILAPLRQAREKLILKGGGLHPVFLVTPPFVNIEPDWKNYERIINYLYQEMPDAEAVADYLGISRGQLCTYAFNPPTFGNKSERVLLYRRFYSSILLFTIIQEWPLTSVSSRLTNNVSRGQLQLLQKEAGTFCGMTVVFCKKLNWHLLASCLEDFSGRLSFGARKDILPLVRICPEVTAIRAREFVKDGIKTAEELADTDIRRVTQLLMDAMPHSNVNSGNKKSNSPTGDATSNETNSKPSVTRENIVALKDNGREAQRALCERLAKLILSKAKQHVRDEDKHRFKSILS